MLRSLFAGISGLRVNQTMLDVTGNNIANANTIGFKSSTTVFSDTLSQMLTAASAPGATRGGTNPIQIGLGVQLASVTGNFSQGSNETTGNPTDMMLNGDGFFVTSTVDPATGNYVNSYTRAGAFHWDQNGNLVAPDGKFVMGYSGDTPIAGYAADGSPLDSSGNPVKLEKITQSMNSATAPAGATLTSYEIGADGKVTGTYSDGTRTEIGQIAVATCVNPQGLEKVGDTEYVGSVNSGPVVASVAGQGTRGSLTVGSLEMSNVDLAAEFTNLILAQRGFEASSKVITTSDQVLEDLVNMKR